MVPEGPGSQMTGLPPGWWVLRRTGAPPPKVVWAQLALLVLERRKSGGLEVRGCPA